MSRFGKTAASYLVIRIAVVAALGALVGGCFQPLYGNQNIPAGDSVRDKFSEVEIPEIIAQKGTPDARIAVALRNALLYDFNGGAPASAPAYRLVVTAVSLRMTVVVDVSSGRAENQVEGINAALTLIELPTKKVVLSTSTFARASFDTPGTAQRFAQQRAGRNAEDRAVNVLADNIRNRLASYFVAGT
jgi:LPS-assembly lipoprotein